MLNGSIDREIFSQCMSALKYENKQFKRIVSSKQNRIGELIVTFFKKNGIKQTFNHIINIIRWKRLCLKFPIDTVEKKSEYNANYFSETSFIVYTCIFGKYDMPQEPIFQPNNCKFYIITDQEMPATSTWEKIDVSTIIPNYANLTNVEKNRYCKMLPFKIFPEEKYSVYIDGNIKVITDLTEFINNCGNYGMSFHKHKARNCAYDEAEACKIMKKAKPDHIDKLVLYLEKNNFPRHYGMLECNAIVRDHTNPVMKKVMLEWWEEFLKHEAKRDQLTFPYVLWKNHIPVSELAVLGNNIDLNDALLLYSHL